MAINNQIKSVLSSLDNAKVSGSNSHGSGPIVGGRFDLVVHSMGFAARHYSSIPSLYSGNRNRTLGAFRTVVTLDTPEHGSGLTNFLLQPAVAAGTCGQAEGKPCYPVQTEDGPPYPATTAGLLW